MRNLKVLKWTLGFLILFGMLLPLAGEDSPQNIFVKEYVKRRFADLDEVVARPKLLVDDLHIYLCDLRHCRVIAFSKKDWKKQWEYGRRGEGPGEFVSIYDVFSYKNLIYISTISRVCIISQQGKLLKEIRRPGGGEYFAPFGDNFIGREVVVFDDNTGDHSFMYTLLDPQLKKIKNIYQFDYNEPIPQPGKREKCYMFHDCRKIITYDDKLFVGQTDKGFYIAIFDLNGNKIREINKEYEKIPITNKVKENVFANLKRMYKERYNEINRKYESIFQDYFPAYVNFYPYQNRLYVFNYPRLDCGGYIEVLVLDFKGNTLQSKMIPVSNLFLNLQFIDLHYFHDGKLYLAIDQEESTRITELDVAAVFRTPGK